MPQPIVLNMPERAGRGVPKVGKGRGDVFPRKTKKKLLTEVGNKNV